MYTPINAHKLSKEARKEFDRVMAILKTQAKHVSVPWRLYDEFLETMPITERKFYENELPLGDKVILRK